MHLQDSPFMGKKRTRIVKFFRFFKLTALLKVYKQVVKSSKIIENIGDLEVNGTAQTSLHYFLKRNIPC